MAWLTSTKTAVNSGTSSMASGTGLSRTLVTIPTSVVITAFEFDWQVGLGVGAGTYGTLGVGVTSQFPLWFVGISYVPSPGSAPNIATTPEDSHFLDMHNQSPGFDRLTINTAGAPAYQDEYRWSGVGMGRVQIPSAGGGTVFMHVGNMGANTVTTGWNIFARITYA